MTRTFDILVVDDEPVVLEGIKRVLLPEGLSVDEAAGADAALMKLRESRYRMVLSDLVLPGLGGVGLLQAIHREWSRTPVVMITGYATLGSAVESFKNGAFDFLPKPFDVGELLAVVRRALSFFDLDSRARNNVDFAEFARQLRDGAVEPVELLSLGQHAWASVLRNGSARLGVGESFTGLRGGLHLELPEMQEKTLQGNECARLIGEDGLVHRMRAPLSGTIVEANPEWKTAWRNLEPLAGNWLLSILPTDLENESGNLTPR